MASILSIAEPSSTGTAQMSDYRNKIIRPFIRPIAAVIGAIAIAILAGMLADRTHLFHPHKELYLAFVFGVGIASGLALLRLSALKSPPRDPHT
jgi:hypothetical protein